MAIDMNGYVDVAERIRQLREKHPEAVLRPYNPDEPFKIMTIGNREFIIYTAACYRTPDDPLPAIAVAAEPAVGKTNFTRDSELMNAETSAWGRAIVAALAADTQKIASLDEVRNRRADEAAQSVPRHPAKGVRAPMFESTEDAVNMVAEKFGGEIVDAAPSARIRPMSGVSEPQKKTISNLAKEVVDGDVAPLIKELFGDGLTVNDLNKQQASTLISALIGRKGKQ
jgi:hypothetical protein